MEHQLSPQLVVNLSLKVKLQDCTKIKEIVRLLVWIVAWMIMEFRRESLLDTSWRSKVLAGGGNPDPPMALGKIVTGPI